MGQMRVLALALAVLAVGCEEDLFGEPDGGMTMLDGGGGGPPTFADVFASFGPVCADCHAPGAPGFIDGETEATQNWSSLAAAQSSLNGNASGLFTPFDACDGVPLVVPNQPNASLIMAYLDSSVRASFSANGGACNADTIADGFIRMSVANGITNGDVENLRSWIAAGAN
ncbi:MAG: hypothetical protein AAGH15_18210 [Myxococcota bacterium]